MNVRHVCQVWSHILNGSEKVWRLWRERRVWILSRSTGSRLGQTLDRRASCVSQRKWSSYTSANQFPNCKLSLDKTEIRFSSQVLIKRSVPNSTNTAQLKKQQLLLWIWLPGDTRPQSELISRLRHELHEHCLQTVCNTLIFQNYGLSTRAATYLISTNVSQVLWMHSGCWYRCY